MTLARHRMLGGFTKQEQITYYGSAFALGNVGTLVPPTGMRQGDLVYVYSTVSSGSFRSLTISPTGGQTWNTTKIRDGSVSGSRSLWISWAIFNGTWSANPAFAISGTTVSKGYIMHVSRAPKQNAVWAVDQGPTTSNVTSVSTTYTAPGLTNTQPKTVTIFCFDCGLNWVSTGGANWYRTGVAQYEITGANNHTVFFAHNIQGYRYPAGAQASCVLTTDSAGGAFLAKISFYFT